MPRLFITNENEGHNHVVLIRDDGTGVTSEDNGHTHNVSMSITQLQEILPVEFIVNQANSEAFILSMSHNHSHILEEISLDEDTEFKFKSDEDLLTEVGALIKGGIDTDKDYLDRGRTMYNYFNGDQWAPSVKSELNQSGRAAHTINMIRPMIRALSGIQRQNRSDIKYLPIEKSTPFGAEVANAVSKFVLDKADYHFYESEAFLDAIITGRGTLELFVTKDLNSRGVNIKVNVSNWNMIFYGPHTKKDLGDCEYVVKSRWFSLAKAKKMFPDKEDEITERFNDLADMSSRDIEQVSSRDDYNGSSCSINGRPIIDIEHKTVLLTETWKKDYSARKILILDNGRTDFFFEDSFRLPSKIFNRFKNIEGISADTFDTFDMTVVTSIAGVILEKRVSPIKDFNVFPIYASKTQDFVMGIVEPMIDPQNELNKNHSKMSDIINTQTGSSIAIDREMFQTPRDFDDYMENSSTPGYITVLKNANQSGPVSRPVPGVPSEIPNMFNLSVNTMQQLSGIGQELLGQQSNARSGTAIQARVRQSLITNEDIFDNQSLMKKRLGKVLIQMIQDVLTVEDTYDILIDSDINEPFEITQDQEGNPISRRVGEMPEIVVKKFLENEDFTKYDVSVSESANTPTKNMERLELFTSAMSTGSVNPLFIELMKDAGLISPIDAQKFLAMLQQQGSEQAQQEKLKSTTELAKSSGPEVSAQVLQSSLQQT